MKIKNGLLLSVSFLLLFAPVFLISYFYVLPAYAKRLHVEQYYQIQWCQENNGKTEVVLKDRTRVDCLTGTHSVEVDFSDKWAEAVGQSLHYSAMTGKRAGIVLIVEKETDKKYVDRMRNVIEHFSLPIDFWIMTE